MTKRLNNYIELSKKPPVDRSVLFPSIREKLVSLVESIPVLSDTIRKELDMWDYSFQVPPNKGYTEEETK